MERAWRWFILIIGYLIHRDGPDRQRLEPTAIGRNHLLN
jgi:hypothetical protein